MEPSEPEQSALYPREEPLLPSGGGGGGGWGKPYTLCCPGQHPGPPGSLLAHRHQPVHERPWQRQWGPERAVRNGQPRKASWKSRVFGSLHYLLTSLFWTEFAILVCSPSCSLLHLARASETSGFLTPYLDFLLCLSAPRFKLGIFCFFHRR